MTQARVDRPNHRWLRTLLSGKPHFVIGSGESPYLLRWFLIPRNTKLNIYLHKFLQSDDDRALHGPSVVVLLVHHPGRVSRGNADRHQAPYGSVDRFPSGHSRAPRPAHRRQGWG